MRTPEQEKEYQRQYRAKRRLEQSIVSATAKPELVDPVVEEILREDPTLMDIKPRPPLPKDDGRGVSRDYRDLIQNMSQARRDEILARINVSKRTPQR
jgi:hypothetical protein